MKGQQDIVSAILLTGILITVIGSVYFWGVPLIQKNQDVSTLNAAENFIKNLNEKIKFVVNNAGRDEMAINVPGIVSFQKSAKTIKLQLYTQGTIYSTGGAIPLYRVPKGSSDACNAAQDGVWGEDVPEVICVTSTEIGTSRYLNEYTLKYRKLTKDSKTFDISFSGTTDVASGGEGHTISIEYDSSSTALNPIVKITIV